MPAFLSDGSRQYNQMRRIHPRDSVSQLGYYLPSNTSTSSSSSRRDHSPAKVNHNKFKLDNFKTPEDSEQSQETDAGDRKSSVSDGGSSLFYASTLAKILTKPGNNTSHLPWKVSNFTRYRRGKKKQDIDDTSSQQQQQHLPPTQNGSPLGSSGFSEGTLVEHTSREYFGWPAHQVHLKDPPNLHLSAYDSNQNKLRYSKRLSSLAAVNLGDFDKQQQVGSASSSQHPVRRVIASSRQHIARLKRRNISRLNRRMLMNGDDANINQYALSELFSQSEIPGFREIFASDSYLRKFCWIVAFLFMTVLSLNDMTELITEYYEYPITVDVRLRDSARLPFPSVTVCNLNVVRFSALCTSSQQQDSRFDLANQIPSELRDKLCGIQVEKKNTTSDSDISDINNIGISTTTTTTTTISMPIATTTSGATLVSSTLSGAPTSVPNDRATKRLQSGHTDNFAADEATQTATEQIPQRQTQTSSQDDSAAEHKTGGPQTTTTQQATTIAQSSTQRQRTTANGGLDLGDFADQSLLVMDRSPVRWRKTERGHKRSIRVFDSDDGSQSRPFASSKSRVRIVPPPVDGQQPPPVNNDKNKERHTFKQRVAANQFNKQGPANIQTNNNRANMQPNSGQGPALGIRGNGVPVGPGAVTVNSYQNPLLPTMSPTTPPMSQAASTTTFVPPALPEDFELTERQERELQENLTNWLAVMYNRDPQLTWSLGHQFDDMILRCTMKSINCTHQRSFENSFSPTEGNCFTYRSKIRRRTGGGGGSSSSSANKGRAVFEEANLAGTNHGLELVLNLEKNEYISGSSQVGALVMIHHPSDLGYAASEATFVAPEFTTYIGLKMVNITRLPAPYPEYCVDSWPAKFADTLTRNSTYSQQACLKICLQKTIQSHCQCQSAFLPIVELDGGGGNNNQAPASSSGGGNSSESAKQADQQQNEQQQQQQQQRIIICDTRKLATRHCVRDVMFRAADRVHNCECPPKCQVVRYDKTISMARWPTREDKVSFDRGKMDVNFQNLAKVIVYFQTMTCEEVTQQAVFNAAKLFSALGGIMGMYVGFSFLSVFEIFEVMSRKMWHHFTVKLTNTTSRIVNNLRTTAPNHG